MEIPKVKKSIHGIRKIRCIRKIRYALENKHWISNPCKELYAKYAKYANNITIQKDLQVCIDKAKSIFRLEKSEKQMLSWDEYWDLCESVMSKDVFDVMKKLMIKHQNYANFENDFIKRLRELDYDTSNTNLFNKQ